MSAAAKKAADAHEANVKKQAARVKLIGQVRPGSAQSHWLKSSFYLQPQLWGKGGPKAKADRQEAKLAKNREEEPALLAAKEASAKEVEPVAAELEHCEGLVTKLTRINFERNGLFEAAVHAFHGAEVGRIEEDFRRCRSDPDAQP